MVFSARDGAAVLLWFVGWVDDEKSPAGADAVQNLAEVPRTKCSRFTGFAPSDQSM